MAAMPSSTAKPKEDDQLRMDQDGEQEGEEGAKPDDPLVVHKCLEIIFQLMQVSDLTHKSSGFVMSNDLSL